MRELLLQTLRVLQDEGQDQADDPGQGGSAEVTQINDTEVTTNTHDTVMSNTKKYAIVLLVLFIIVFLTICTRGFKKWKLRRERQLLQIQSSRADAVLGDMQVRSFIFCCLQRTHFLARKHAKQYFISSSSRWFQRMTNMMIMTLNYYKFENNSNRIFFLFFFFSRLVHEPFTEDDKTTGLYILNCSKKLLHSHTIVVHREFPLKDYRLPLIIHHFRHFRFATLQALSQRFSQTGCKG
jgi:hypothetical protein